MNKTSKFVNGQHCKADEKMNKINEFVKGFPAKGTQKTYRMHLKKYFKTINADPKSYFNDKRNYEQDVITFWQNLQDYAPLTRISRLSCIRTFLEENDVTIPPRIWKNLRKRSKGKRAVTIDTVPTNEELRNILQHADIMTKTVALIACSGGMRVGEILGLLPDDVKTDSDPLKIHIRPEIAKNGEARICFVTNETKEMLQQWNNVRDEWLSAAVKKAKGIGGKKKDNPRIFPIDYSTFNTKWVRCLKKAKLDERDQSTKIKIHILHFHTLRKFFETRMSYAGIPEAIYQRLEGHEGYMNGVYKRFTEQELKDEYKKGMNNLLIFEAQPDLSEVHSELKEKDGQLHKQQEEIQKLKQEMQNVKLDLANVQYKQIIQDRKKSQTNKIS